MRFYMQGMQFLWRWPRYGWKSWYRRHWAERRPCRFWSKNISIWTVCKMQRRIDVSFTSINTKHKIFTMSEALTAEMHLLWWLITLSTQTLVLSSPHLFLSLTLFLLQKLYLLCRAMLELKALLVSGHLKLKMGIGRSISFCSRRRKANVYYCKQSKVSNNIS